MIRRRDHPIRKTTIAPPSTKPFITITTYQYPLAYPELTRHLRLMEINSRIDQPPRPGRFIRYRLSRKGVSCCLQNLKI